MPSLNDHAERPRRPRLLFLATAIALLALPAAAQRGIVRNTRDLYKASGEVTWVWDGDTADVDIGPAIITVHIKGIDAPERDQAFGEEAYRHVAELVRGEHVVVRLGARAASGGFVGEIYHGGGANLAQTLVRAGYAWSLPGGEESPVLDPLEAEARAEGLGIWSEPDPETPWDYRVRQAEVARAKKLRQDSARQVANGPVIDPAELQSAIDDATIDLASGAKPKPADQKPTKQAARARENEIKATPSKRVNKKPKAKMPANVVTKTAKPQPKTPKPKAPAPAPSRTIAAATKVEAPEIQLGGISLDGLVGGPQPPAPVGPTEYEIKLPKTKIAGIRVDPTNAPGNIEIRSIKIYGAKKIHSTKVDRQGNYKFKRLKFAGKTPKGANLRAENNDPYFELRNLPKLDLTSVANPVMRIDLLPDAGTFLEVYWDTGDGKGFSRNQRIRARIKKTAKGARK